MFRTLLIANRGEIACRIVRTARRLGVRAIAVYSDADEGALHTRVADLAVRIGPPPARESYLDIEALLRVARESGAEAIHPGYGFVSQSAEFAERCAAAGIAFVGPGPAAIRAMGVKDQAKTLMMRAGVPVVPGYLGERQDEETLAAEAQRIGYPLLVKAIAGGGGKGMRIVHAASELEAACIAARGEAERAFGDGRVMLERYVEHARHVEVQVIADRQGNCLHLLERDCSLQRRYQKVIEETPAPALSNTLRLRLYEAAVAAARTIGYENAGTVEFVVDGEDFFFLEMNTRLQVEHPVTEAILGIDLVEWQLRVAAGESLPSTQAEIKPRGHAFEARIYAEDPRRGFLPAGGRVTELAWPPGTRVDAGVEEGDRVITDYDALLAKLIVHDTDRRKSLAKLLEALRTTRIAGVTTNLAALIALARDPDVARGRVFTSLIDERGENLLPPQGSQRERAATAAAASLVDVARSSASPWQRADAWTLQASHQAYVRLVDTDGITHVVRWSVNPAVETAAIPATCRIEADRVSVWLDGEWHRFARVGESGDAAAHAGEETVRAPMPGMVLALKVGDGDDVRRGQALLVLEAMKMEHTLTAGAAGTVTEVRVKAGQRVREGEVLLSVR
jgi:3-methylcrotonyl-CoA carboxylase alpha subunit